MIRIRSLLVLLLLAACTTRFPIEAVRWSETDPVFRPKEGETPGRDSARGYLRVETDRELLDSGDIRYYQRKPYDLYGPDGQLVRPSVDNKGWRNGEEPVYVALEAGRYVVGSYYGLDYHRIQVEVLPGLTTEVPESALREASSVHLR